jgi:hypothetical protein
MKVHCPSCDKVLYSRRLARCGFCGAEIPEALRFTAEEIAALDRSLAESAARRKENEREFEEREAKRRADSDSATSFPPLF